MNIFLTLAFLFFIGATLGWVLELLFRRFFSSANPERKWINPGFCVGPYLPLYGCGLCFLYLIASLEQFSIIRDPFWNRVVLFLIMAVCMTVTEYFAGLIALKGYMSACGTTASSGAIFRASSARNSRWRGPFSARRIIF